MWSYYDETMQVSQIGNIANNGFFNLMILSDSSQFSRVSVITSSLDHAFSQPAWEIVDIDKHTISSIDAPSWPASLNEFNMRFITKGDLSFKDDWRFGSAEYLATLKNSGFFDEIDCQKSDNNQENGDSYPRKNFFGYFYPLLRNLIQLVGSHRLKKLLDSDIQAIHITIGASWPRPPLWRKKIKSVVIEHGQIRWIEDGSHRAKKERKKFSRFVKKSDLLLVTNLDLRSLEIAEELVPGKWCAFPHPYVLDQNAPYEADPALLLELQNKVSSKNPFFMGSSLSFSGDQKKGSQKVLEAIAIARQELDLDVGLLAVEWGADADKFYDYIQKLGLEAHVHLLQPMSRIRLMKHMACCSAVFDQFEYDAFGGFTIRALEQGVPLISRPISEYAANLIGAAPPVLAATSVPEIVQQIKYALANPNSGHLGREWVLRHHHESVSLAMQERLYKDLFDSEGSLYVPPNLWSEFFASGV